MLTAPHPVAPPDSAAGCPGSALTRALVRWQRSAGPYWPFVCAASFLGPDPRRPARWGGSLAARRLATLLENCRGPSLAVYVDLPPEVWLPAAPRLNAAGFYLVPVLQRWPAEPAVLPWSRLAAQLIHVGARLRRPTEPAGLAFLLDGGRAGSLRPSRRRRTRAFDNRYPYRADRFPSPEFLLRQGVGETRWVVNAVTGLAGDLRPYLDGLLAAGLTAALVAWSPTERPRR